MNINDINYVFQYPTALNPALAAEQMAEQFCRLNGGDIGIDMTNATPEFLDETCAKPLAAGLLTEMSL